MISAIASKLKSLKRAVAPVAKELREAIEDIRMERLRLIDEKKAVEHSPWPREQVHAAIARGLDAIEERARTALYLPDLVRGQYAPRFPEPPEKAMLALLVAANREGVERLLQDMVEATYSAPNTTPRTREQREAEIARLDEALADVERAEECAIREAERHGLSIARRADIAPDLLLRSDKALGLDAS